ncbi:MAG TPA: hypothetical protein VFK90_09790 [Anaeromyxobacter sp.]|nr:hypothetical protein [Anaeromyxobacter sp.]
MGPATIALVVALALGESKSTSLAPSRALDASNAARARIGLLPRKAPAKAMSPSGRRYLPSPTFLGEPGTLSGGSELAAAPVDPRPGELSARGVTTDVTISLRYDD